MPRSMRTMVAALLVGAAFTLGACGGDDESSGAKDSAVDLVEDGQITTCTHLPYQPFQFEQSGKTVGFDVDMIDLVAKKLGVEQEIFDTPFEGIQSGEDLNSRKCDIAAAAMTITPARGEKIPFSEPYFDADQALLTKKGSGIKSFEDLVGQGARRAGRHHRQGRTRRRTPMGVTLKDFEDLALELKSVQTGGVVAAINDIPVLLDFAKKNPDVEVTATFKTDEKYGFGMKKGQRGAREGGQRRAGDGQAGRHLRPDLQEVVRRRAEEPMRRRRAARIIAARSTGCSSSSPRSRSPPTGTRSARRSSTPT